MTTTFEIIIIINKQINYLFFFFKTLVPRLFINLVRALIQLYPVQHILQTKEANKPSPWLTFNLLPWCKQMKVSVPTPNTGLKRVYSLLVRITIALIILLFIIIITIISARACKKHPRPPLQSERVHICCWLTNLLVAVETERAPQSGRFHQVSSDKRHHVFKLP